jgi:hypothetical protein
MWYYVVGREFPDVSENRNAFIFRVKQSNSIPLELFDPEDEGNRTFETLAPTCPTAQLHIEEDLSLQVNRDMTSI